MEVRATKKSTIIKPNSNIKTSVTSAKIAISEPIMYKVIFVTPYVKE